MFFYGVFLQILQKVAEVKSSGPCSEQANYTTCIDADGYIIFVFPFVCS